jgi:ribosomal-protein-alanine N-acetyltransferase
MKTWRIWRAARTDADTLARLEGLAFGGRSWGEDNVKESFVASRVTVLFGGESAASPQGFAVWRDLGEEAELLTLGVVGAARRKGLGAALLAAVLEAARSEGAQRFFLEVGKDNTAARALYDRMGFIPVGARRRYYADGGDAAVLAFDL